MFPDLVPQRWSMCVCGALGRPLGKRLEQEAKEGRGIDRIPLGSNSVSSLSGVLCILFAWKMAVLATESGLMVGLWWADGRAAGVFVCLGFFLCVYES